ncbi:DUF859 family phage minor structural protein [Youngiibacter multivorans]|uniref:Minor tail protein n=1 Tax=Youngiibacter multivorans TaxID=937251 RepID=A0ABS4G7X5_9CLOT|nr:DUF859 family phage minor structural protein [Youngiibacter multivorans]MBP1920636.1 hypothetical protein [Youngiibacter multivorans]
MALSGSYSYDSWYWYNDVFYLGWDWSATQDINANTSTISIAFKLWRNNTSADINSTAGKTGTIACNGTTTTFSPNYVTLLDPTLVRILGTTTRVINHNAEGQASFTIGGTQQFNVNFAAGYIGTVTIPTQSYTLDTIPRASLITSFPDFTIGSGVTVTAPRYSTSFTNTFQINIGGTVIETTGDLAQDSYTFSAAQLDEIYATIPSAVSTTATAYVTTKLNGSQIGSTQSASATANVGSDIIPTLSSVTAAETVTAVTNLALGTNNFAQTLSRIQFTINGAAGVKSSSVSSYKVVFNSVAYTNSSSIVGTTGAITSTGAIVATATVTDSRGRTSTSKTVTCTLLTYNAPEITAFSAFRSTSGGVASPLGTYAKYTSAATISSLNSKNQITYSIKSKLRTSGTWTTTHVSTSLAVGTTSLSVTPVYGTYTATTSYDLLLTVTDKFNSVTAGYVLSSGEVAMSWSKTGIGVGKVWEQGALDIGGDAYYKGTILESIFVSGAATLIGRTLSPLVTLSSASAWGDLPNGYCGFISHSSVGAPPVSNYGYFIKIASRDMSRGWGGIWIDYSGTGNAFFGRTTDGNVAASWTRIYTSDAAVSHAHDNTSISLSDYVSGTTPKVAGIISGTGAPPTASTVPTGTVYLKYV